MSVEMDKYIELKSKVDSIEKKAIKISDILINAHEAIENIKTSTVSNYTENGKIIGTTSNLTRSSKTIDANTFPKISELAHMIEDYNDLSLELINAHSRLNDNEKKLITR